MTVMVIYAAKFKVCKPWLSEIQIILHRVDVNSHRPFKILLRFLHTEAVRRFDKLYHQLVCAINCVVFLFFRVGGFARYAK
jgi:hypothetical protein